MILVASGQFISIICHPVMPSNLLRLRPFSRLVNLIEKYGNRFILLFIQLKTLDEGINLLLFFVLVEDMNIIDFKVYFLRYEE